MPLPHRAGETPILARLVEHLRAVMRHRPLTVWIPSQAASPRNGRLHLSTEPCTATRSVATSAIPASLPLSDADPSHG
jgi:hypothetical protein